MFPEWNDLHLLPDPHCISDGDMSTRPFDPLHGVIATRQFFPLHLPPAANIAPVVFLLSGCLFWGESGDLIRTSRCGCAAVHTRSCLAATGVLDEGLLWDLMGGG